MDPLDAIDHCLSTIDETDAPELTEALRGAHHLLARLPEIVPEIQSFVWRDYFQEQYRRSRANPPERSLGCIEAIRHLRDLERAFGRPDWRKVIEIGNEHLWELVYGEPIPTGDA